MSGRPHRRVVLAAAGAGWEVDAVRELESARDLVLVRRCVDVAELIAVAQAGGVSVAAVDLSVPGLDLEAVRAVRAAGVTLVGLGPTDRAEALGIDVVGPGSAVLDAVRAVEVSATATGKDLAPGPASVEPGGPSDVADGSTSRRRGTLVVVWGPAGAPGRSAVALALADELGRDDARCVLVDADTYGGAQAQQLGLLDEVSGLMAACRVANQGRDVDLGEHLQALRPSLSVLTGLPRPDMWIHVRRAALERVVERLRDTTDVVVADVGFCLEPGEGVAGAGRNQATAALLELADVVVAVGRADPVGLTRLVRGLHDLDDLGVVRPLVVLNQVRAGIGWGAEELASTVHRLAGARPVALLPQDGPTLDTAALRGATAREVASGSPFVAAVSDLAQHVLGVTHAAVSP
ncbi:hypothetical protein [Aeromicrobium sp. Leaf291]|uniref:AAA family ATPase n=1 Tax=Aeromicrobium sp. Leaf291 TaxID=1736325 RepID=UPI000701B92C|nr:hypothetical protein [Aeromicrobium sp. Leaf291]KQP81254.1 hypothetical protein ASF35_14365 [Aeromicrobium sp. Leaf291]